MSFQRPWPRWFEPGKAAAAAPRPAPLTILAEFAATRGLTLDELRGPDRGRIVAHARQDAMLLLSEATRLSKSQIGRLFNRDHTTVLYGLKAARERRWRAAMYRQHNIGAAA